METLLGVIKTALPVFLALGLGVLCRRKKLLSREGIDTLKKIAVDICLPAVVIGAFATAEYTEKSLILPLVIFLAGCAGLWLGKMLCRKMKMPGTLTPFLMCGFEGGMLGYALFGLLYPGESMSAFALIDLGQAFFCFTIYKALLAGPDRSKKDMVKDCFATPVVWGVIAGLLLGATGLYKWLGRVGIASVIDACTGFISAPTSMLILLSVGYDLNLKSLMQKDTLKTVALRLGIMGGLMGIILLIHHFFPMLHPGAMVLAFMLPAPYVVPVFADKPQEREQVSSALSAMTVVTLGIFAVMCIFV
ncbi:MAG: hypothetical protein IKM64_05980 [Clostridia bacterium]|nr:hypothetical protein [Clostridia bacterium]